MSPKAPAAADGPHPSAACLDMIERLIAIDTTSDKSNLDAIALIRGHLEPLGARFLETFDKDRRKANLYAMLGPENTPAILLSGHTDVVPVDGQNWSSDPFRLTRRGERYYGRGSADMKSFLGLALGLAPEFVRRGLITPLHFAFSYDEEKGCIGVRGLIEDLARLPVKPRLGIVGEPTGMIVTAGHKAKRAFRVQVQGQEGHSSLDQGVNAILAAAEAVTGIGRMQEVIRRNGPYDPAYAPPYTTLHTGRIDGGVALNIVPGHCWFDFEIRALPGDSIEGIDADIRSFIRTRIEPWMKKKAPDCGFSFTALSDTVGFALPDDHEAVVFAADLAGNAHLAHASFSTEAGLFTQAGIPSVVCGPGSIDQAHKPDEYIESTQLAAGETFLRRLMDRICA